MLHFEHSSRVEAPVDVVFAFHERPDALEKLLPPGQRIEVLHREGGLETGARVEFRLHFGPFSKTWVALHTDYARNRFFVDTQIEGPFRSWRHRHDFTSEGSGTRLTDIIDLELPGGRLAEAMFGSMVKAQLEKMFAYRHSVTGRECEGTLRAEME
jgi:ligand-binding SRPBCC domain-containing protein